MKKYTGPESLKYLIELIKTALMAKIDTSAIVDDLNTEDTTKPLSARQGKVLLDKITSSGGLDYSTYDPDKDGSVVKADHATTADSATDATTLGGVAAESYATKEYIVGLSGQANGLAPLNGDRQIDSTYLPSYVDDVIEGYLYDGQFYSTQDHDTEPLVGERGKIYVDITDGVSDSYRYSGSVYIAITSSDMVEITTEEIDTYWQGGE